ncbi:MAG: hypothetical protein RIS76_2871 [Verrucomicrobiota bacterium]|jgi:RNA polymerase sigma factor (sigma-70 family)
MNPESDQELLSRYSRHGEESAFAKIVRHQVDWVYSAACRIVVDPHLAEDITQTVFTTLARDSAAVVRRLQDGIPLSAWLHRTTRNVAAKTVRTEERRRTREHLFVMNPDTTTPAGDEEVDWNQISPQLDAAISELPDTDRDALLLRFFERHTAREIGSRLGIGEEAAQKRVVRAMERLRGLLVARGLTISVAGLTTAVATHAVQSAPAGLASSVGLAALASGSAGTTAWMLAGIPAKSVAVGTTVVAIGLAITAGWQQRELRRLHSAQQPTATAAESLPVPVATGVPTDEELRAEVLKLRGEVSRLLREQAELRQAAARRSTASIAPATASESGEPQDLEAARQLGLRKLNFAKNLALTCHLYAGDHDDHFPGSFADAARYAEKSDDTEDLSPDQFELMYQGPLAIVANPSRTILLREKEPFPSFGRPGFSRTYGFLDGHSEIVHRDDGNFESFEAERTPTIILPAGATGSN